LVGVDATVGEITRPSEIRQRKFIRKYFHGPGQKRRHFGKVSVKSPDFFQKCDRVLAWPVEISGLCRRPLP
jgi:hypothetical protein